MNLKLIGCTMLTAIMVAGCAHHTPDTMQTGQTPQLTQTDQHADVSLSSYHWRLSRAVDAAGISEPNWLRPQRDPVSLTFNDRHVAITGLCNAMNAGVSITGSSIQISDPVSTMRMCPDTSLMRYEQAIGQRLPQAASWHISHAADQTEHPQLTLKFRDGAQWVFVGEPTTETQYGSTGETLFIEVAAATVPCSDPLIAQRQCLNVRTVQYNESGTKISQGPWQPFYDHIKDYQHQPGVRNILRVKRYTVENPPADASAFAYVLDMVVESETVNPRY